MLRIGMPARAVFWQISMPYNQARVQQHRYIHFVRLADDRKVLGEPSVVLEPCTSLDEYAGRNAVACPDTVHFDKLASFLSIRYIRCKHGDAAAGDVGVGVVGCMVRSPLRSKFVAPKPIRIHLRHVASTTQQCRNKNLTAKERCIWRAMLLSCKVR